MTISWSQPEPVQCVSTAGNAQSLALNESATWRCEASISTEFTGELPDDLALTWVLEADYAGDAVAINVLPGSDVELVSTDVLPADGAAQVRMRVPWIDANVQMIAFEVAATRTSCVVGSADLRFAADPQFETANANLQVARTDAAADPPVVTTTTAASNGEPSVRFEGPIVFDSLTGTSAGLSSSITRGTAVIIIEGEWNPCSTWTLNLSGAADMPAETPAQLRVISINEEPLPGGACELGTACDLIVLPETGSAATPLSYTIGLELQLHELTPAGNFGIDMHAALNGVETQP